MDLTTGYGHAQEIIPLPLARRARYVRAGVWGGGVAGWTICAPQEHASQTFPSSPAVEITAPLALRDEGHQGVEHVRHGAGRVTAGTKVQ
jgi:hypothetical protein